MPSSGGPRIRKYTVRRPLRYPFSWPNAPSQNKAEQHTTQRNKSSSSEIFLPPANPIDSCRCTSAAIPIMRNCTAHMKNDFEACSQTDLFKQKRTYIGVYIYMDIYVDICVYMSAERSCFSKDVVHHRSASFMSHSNRFSWPKPFASEALHPDNVAEGKPDCGFLVLHPDLCGASSKASFLLESISISQPTALFEPKKAASQLRCREPWCSGAKP